MFQLPHVLTEWQILIGTIVVHVAVERLARLSRVDCDTCRTSC